MWSGRAIARTSASTSASTAAAAISAVKTKMHFANWSAAVTALAAASDDVVAHREALLTIPDQPKHVALRVLQHCLTMQRYSDACASAAFPQLCDAMLAHPEVGDPDAAATVIRLSMQRGAYVDSAGFGRLMRLYNARQGAKAHADVSRLWTWIQHTRAAYCSIARSAIIASTARDGQHGAAMRLEAALRVDGVLLREEGLVPLIQCLPFGEWSTAVSLVRHWSIEHRACVGGGGGEGSDTGAPSLATAMALVRTCATAGRATIARAALAHWLEDTDVLMAMTKADLKDALSAVLPACRPSARTATTNDAASPTPQAATTADLLGRLLLASSAAVAELDRPFSRYADDVQVTVTELLGHMAAAAALLHSRDDLLAVGDHMVRLGFGSTRVHEVMAALVEPLQATAWREAKLAAAELSRKTGMEVPMHIQARLHVLHQAMVKDSDAVLDAAIGR